MEQQQEWQCELSRQSLVRHQICTKFPRPALNSSRACSHTARLVPLRFKLSSVSSVQANQVLLVEMPEQLPLFRDPWAKREAFRKHPVFSNRVMFRNLFPGFGIAVVAFTAYVAVDNYVLSKPDAHKHDSAHH